MLHCNSCVDDMKNRLGCAPGTVASEQLTISDQDYQRCPIAMLRDMTPEESALLDWGLRMAVAKEDGSLSVWLDKPSARAYDLIHFVENERNKIKNEQLQKMSKSGG